MNYFISWRTSRFSISSKLSNMIKKDFLLFLWVWNHSITSLVSQFYSESYFNFLKMFFTICFIELNFFKSIIKAPSLKDSFRSIVYWKALTTVSIASLFSPWIYSNLSPSVKKLIISIFSSFLWLKSLKLSYSNIPFLKSFLNSLILTILTWAVSKTFLSLFPNKTNFCSSLCARSGEQQHMTILLSYLKGDVEF